MRKGYIVEDHPTAQQWLGEALQSAFPQIAHAIAATVADAHSLLDQGYPDIALVDLNLPDGSGIEIIERISCHAPEAAIIVTTIYDDDDHLFPALRAGAGGYILKEQRKEEISQMLQGIVNGEPPLSPAISQRLIKYFSSRQMQSDLVKDDQLTARELEVLALIAQGDSLNEVGNKLGITRNTVASQVKSIYSKLNISSRAEAAIAAARMGLITPH